MISFIRGDRVECIPFDDAKRKERDRSEKKDDDRQIFFDSS